MSNNIAKNTSYFTLALVLQKVISFTYFAILARNLAPDDLGKYYFAISFTTIFAIFIDIGLANVLTREISKAQNKAERLLGTALAIKLPLAILSLTLVAVIINALGYPELTKILVYISSVSMVLDSFTVTFWSVMRGFHNLKYESIGVLMFQVVAFSFGLTALKLNMGLPWLIAALALASSINFLFSFSLLVGKWKLRPWPNYRSLNTIKTLFIITIPFALFAIFQRTYMYLDTVLLSRLAGDYYVGLYQIAFKMVFALQFLPMAFVAALYPAFAKYWKTEKEIKPPRLATTNSGGLISPLTVSFERAINYLLIIGVPISVGIIVLASEIIKIFKPEYITAVLPLRIIMASLVFIFLNFPIGSLLNACDRQKINTRNMGIALALSFGLNLILIPKFNVVGASLTVLLTNMLMFFLGVWEIPKIIKIRISKNISVLAKTILAALLMSTLLILLQSFINIFINILFSGILYLVMLYLLKGYTKKDLLSMVKIFRK